MFGFGKSIEVFPVSFKDGYLKFRSPKKITEGKSVKVKLLLAGQDSPTISLKITEMQEGLEDFTGVGLVKERSKKLQELTYQMTLAGVEGACRRNTKRVSATIRLRSRQLPNYRGITANVNETGIEMHLDSHIPNGTAVSLEFDIPEMAEIQIQGVSIWTKEIEILGKPTHRVGVEFNETDTRVLEAWSNFYRRILQTEGASVMMKSMGDGSDGSLRESQRVAEARESGRHATVEGMGQSAENLPSSPAPTQTPPTPPFQPPAPSTPNFQPPAPSTPPFQPPAPSTPPFQSPSTPSTPQFAPPPTGSSTPPAGQPSPPTFSPPSTPAPTFNPSAPRGPGAVPPFSSPKAPTFPGSSSPPPFGQRPAGPPPFGNLSPNKPPSLPTNYEASDPRDQKPLKLGLPQSPSIPEPKTFGSPGTGAPSFSPPGGGSSFTPPPLNLPSAGPPSFMPPPAQPSHQSQFAPAPNQQNSFRPPVPPAAQPPERVAPMKISGPNIMFRCRQGALYQTGARVKIELVVQVQGQTQSVVVSVSITGSQRESDGTYTCVGLIQEDQQRIQILNQLLGG